VAQGTGGAAGARAWEALGPCPMVEGAKASGSGGGLGGARVCLGPPAWAEGCGGLVGRVGCFWGTRDLTGRRFGGW
jgi:hypothetical protein